MVYPCVKKHLLACPTSKHRSKAGPVSHGLRCRCVQVRQGFGIFIDLCKEVFFLQHYAVGVVLPPQFEFFYIKSEKKTMHHSTLRINNSSTTMLSSLILYDSFISISQLGQLTIGVLIPIDSARTISPCAQLEASFACFHIESMMLTKANPFI